MSNEDIANALNNKFFSNHAIQYVYIPSIYQEFYEGSGSATIYHATAYNYGNADNDLYGTSGTFHVVDAQAGIVSLQTASSTLNLQILGSNTNGSLLYFGNADSADPYDPIRMISADNFNPGSPQIGAYDQTTSNSVGHYDTGGEHNYYHYDSRNNFNLGQIHFDNFHVDVVPVCFAAGTRLAVPGGDKAIEELRIGDSVITSSGDARIVRWIGSQSVQTRLNAHSPVRVSAHAFGRNRPSEDLILSPAHGICVDLLGEIIIPVGLLVNDATIVQIDIPEIEYWHVELDSHDILIANGLPSESYLEDGNRSFFGRDVISTSPRIPANDVREACRPYVRSGLLLDAARHQLFSKAEALGWTRTEPVISRSVWISAHDQRFEPEISGLTCRFHLPAGSGPATLLSTATAPSRVSFNIDSRRLGLCLKSLTIRTATGDRRIPLEALELGQGLHAMEALGRRWTNGRMLLPEALLGRQDGDITIEIELAAPPLPIWKQESGRASAAAHFDDPLSRSLVGCEPAAYARQ